MISEVDKFIVEGAPWKLAKSSDDGAQDKLDDTLYTAAETLRIVTALLYPVIPHAAKKIWAQLGIQQPLDSLQLADLNWGGLQSGQKVGEVSAIFPRLDAKPTVDKML